MKRKDIFGHATARLACASLALAGIVLAASPVWALPRAGQVAPNFSLPRLDGPWQTLAAFKGKPVYLNFFASWCGPCNDEAPAVVGFAKKYESRGLVTLGVNELENKAGARVFANKFRVRYPIVLDEDGKMGNDYGAAFGLPVHVFIDRNGKISTYRLGQITPGEIEAAIKKIL